MPVLIDSSLWIHHLRRSGSADLRERVDQLLRSGDAAWCPPVRLELWRGVGSAAERKALLAFEASISDFPISEAVWDFAIRLAGTSRASGLTAPLADFLVFACAHVHGLDLAHADHHFDRLAAVRI